MPTKPSKLDCSDIIAPKSKDLLTGISKQHTWQNIQLKHGLREEEDFLLVTPQIFEFATTKYGLEGEPIIRYGIAQADGETVVELYLAKLNLLVVPNALFKFTCAKQVLISRNATLQDLEKKVIGVLNYYMYQNGNKSTILQKVRLWKSTSNNVEEIQQLDKKYQNYTKIKFDGLLLEDTTVDNMAIANDDILIVEL